MLAELTVEIAPGFQLSDAVGAPAAAEELDDERADGEQVAGADDLAAGVFEGELGSVGTDGENVVFDAGGEEVFNGALTYCQTLGLNEVAGVRGDLVELVLKGGHCFLRAFWRAEADPSLRLPRGHFVSTGPQAAPLRMTLLLIARVRGASRHSHY